MRELESSCDLSMKMDSTFSVAILAQASSCSKRAQWFSVHEVFWFCLVQVSTTQFCSFPPVLMACFDDGSEVPISPEPGTSSNHGSPDGPTPDPEGSGPRPSTMGEETNEMFLQFAQLSLILQSVSRFEDCVQTLSQTVATCSAKKYKC